jgi:hypothetical protein
LTGISTAFRTALEYGFAEVELCIALEEDLGYYIRVLGTDTSNIAIDRPRASAAPGVIDVDSGLESDWKHIVLRHPSGQEIAIVERNLVIQGELGAEELNEFIEEVQLHSLKRRTHGSAPSYPQ